MTEPLLVVDVQNLVVARAWRRDEVIATIADLVGRARAAGTPVVWVRHQAEHLPYGSDEWQIVDELVPVPSEPIVEKTYGDAFADTDLDQVLRDLGATGVIITGAESYACVQSTFNGALYRGYDATVVGDAHTCTDLPEEYGGFRAPRMVEFINLLCGGTALPGRSTRVVNAADLTFEAAPAVSDAELSEQVLAEEESDPGEGPDA